MGYRMSDNITLGEAWNRVEELSRRCHDDHIRRDEIQFEDLDTIRISGESHRLRPIAQQEVCSRIGVPAAYMKKCPVDLQNCNLNYWLNQMENEDLLFRFDGDDVRAIFTTKYQPVDNHMLVRRLFEMGYSPNAEVQLSLDSEFMSLSIPERSGVFSISRNDDILPGFSLSNSEVGQHAVHVGVFFLRLVCTNGMIGSDKFESSFRHVSDKVLQGLPEIMSSMSKEQKAIENKMRFSLQSPVHNPKGTFESFNRQFALSDGERRAVEWAWPKEVGNTMFHVVQTYTRASQMPGLTAESSYRLQRVGGQVLSLVK
jgi:hypothetical protein